MSCLSFSETKNPAAVEMRVCIPFGKLPRFESDQTKALDEAIRAAPLKVFRSLDAQKRELRSRIIQRYSEFCTVRLDSATRVYIAAVSRSFNEACLLLAYTQYRSLHSGFFEMNYFEFSRLVCPDGLPGEKDLEALWESQKVDVSARRISRSENLMDYPGAFKSIQW